MSNNSNLHAAKKAKNDEFYTRLDDISEEMYHYKDQFKDKVVFCNCDDPTCSAFWRYFHLMFNELGLKKLISTHYDTDKATYKMEYTGEDDNDVEVGTVTRLNGNGDFRNKECVDLLDECDIVVTNPPFSLFKEYIPLLIEYGKKFLVIGSMDSVTCKNIFPLFKEGKMWAGYSFNKTMEFTMPDSYELKGKAYIDDKGVKHGFVPAICWFTNLEVKKRHEELILWKEYTPEAFPKYDNYDAIHIDKVVNIPYNYNGVMGVPISFLKDYCPEQFEILGLERYTAPKEILVSGRLAINGKVQFPRILIRRKTND